MQIFQLEAFLCLEIAFEKLYYWCTKTLPSDRSKQLHGLNCTYSKNSQDILSSMESAFLTIEDIAAFLSHKYFFMICQVFLTFH